MARLLRAPSAQQAEWAALALQLSRLPPPAPRPYHRRIARALMQDAAARANGQVFGLANGDLVLLLRPMQAAEALATTMARLFRIDAPDPTTLLSLWPLPSDRGPALAYVEAQLHQGAPRPPTTPDPFAALRAIGPLSRLIAQAPPTQLLRRQTAVLLSPTTGSHLQPLYQELTFAQAEIAAQLPAAREAATDPFLVRHVATLLDQRLLAVMTDDVGRGGPLSRAGPAGTRMHVNLTSAAILSDVFPHFSAACAAAGILLGVEVALLDACADPESFALVRDRLRQARLPLVLDGVSHHAALLTRPGALQADLVKLEWSRLLPGSGQELAEAVATLGPGRIVLHRAETEAALRWGLAHGIRRFQGRHVDAMLAARRIGSCRHAGACSMRQCTDRAAATGPEGRAGCVNPALLDTASPLARAAA